MLRMYGPHIGEVNSFQRSYFLCPGGSTLFGIKNIVKRRKKKYIWESVLSRNKDNLICENLNQFNKFEVQQKLYSFMPFLGTV